jgi:hypothetical protein
MGEIPERLNIQLWQRRCQLRERRERQQRRGDERQPEIQPLCRRLG